MHVCIAVMTCWAETDIHGQVEEAVKGKAPLFTLQATSLGDETTIVAAACLHVLLDGKIPLRLRAHSHCFIGLLCTQPADEDDHRCTEIARAFHMRPIVMTFLEMLGSQNAENMSLIPEGKEIYRGGTARTLGRMSC